MQVWQPGISRPHLGRSSSPGPCHPCLSILIPTSLSSGVPNISTSNAFVTVTRAGDISTITPTPTTLLSPSCPTADGSTYIATNKPPITHPSQITQTFLSFEIRCDYNSAEGGFIVDMQLIANVSTLNDCMNSCALFNFQLRVWHFPAYACTGVSWGYGANLYPRHICWLKSNVTLESPNNITSYPGYHAAVLLDT